MKRARCFTAFAAALARPGVYFVCEDDAAASPGRVVKVRQGRANRTSGGRVQRKVFVSCYLTGGFLRLDFSQAWQSQAGEAAVLVAAALTLSAAVLHYLLRLRC